MSGELQIQGSNKVYYYVFDGSFRTKVPEGSAEALTRINKLNKKVTERSIPALFGMIENIEFEDGDYGKQIKITLDANDDGKNPVISMGVKSSDGRDFLRKLPSIDLTSPVRFMPYKFVPDGESEEKQGISYRQLDRDEQYTVKVESFFRGENKHGHPVIDWDAATESEREIYKIQRDDFLLQYAMRNILPKFQKSTEQETPTDAVEALGNVVAQKDTINPDDIPF